MAIIFNRVYFCNPPSLVGLNKRMSKRKGAWRFSAVWTFPGHMVATTSTDPSRLKNELQQMETEMKRLVLQAERFPPMGICQLGKTTASVSSYWAL